MIDAFSFEGRSALSVGGVNREITRLTCAQGGMYSALQNCESLKANDCSTWRRAEHRSLLLIVCLPLAIVTG